MIRFHYILDRDLATPPGSPNAGDAYIVAASPTGAWAGQDGKVAFYIDNAWRFDKVTTGLRVYIADEGVFLRWNGAAWTQLSQLSLANKDAQIFTATGTWTKPAWAKTVRVILFGGGGGGGSGRRGAAGSARGGGIGGFGSVPSDFVWEASDLASTVAVTVGAAGTGGAAVSADSTNGNAGTAGTVTSFGAYQQAKGGLGGPGGTAAAVNATDSTTDQSGQVAPSASSVTADINLAVPGNFNVRGGCAGGTAGGLTTGNAELAGQKGGYPWGDPAVSAASKGAAGTNGSDGSNSLLTGFGGSGGGAGGANPAGGGGSGGTGGRGAGGGGGGASVNGSNSGAGGNGGPGYAVIISKG